VHAYAAWKRMNKCSWVCAIEASSGVAWRDSCSRMKTTI
jgi:hypothetical protein